LVNLSAFIRYHAARTPDRVAYIYDGRSTTYNGLNRRIAGLAACLKARGVRSGTIVAALMKNSAAFIDLSFAVSHLGAVFLPINYRLAGDEVAYILDHAGASLVVADREFEPLLDPASDPILLAPAEQADSALLGGDPDDAVEPQNQGPDDLFRLMYTSGTTDRPKGVMHRYNNFYWKTMDHVMALGLGADDRLLVVGPLYHAGAYDLPGITVLWAGGMLSIQRDFDPAEALAAIERDRLTGSWMAPTMLNGILSSDVADRHDLDSIKWVIGGGERTPEQRIRAFGETFRRGRYIDAYGLTESCSGDTMMEAGREIEKIGSTGPALAHVAIRIADHDGRALGPGEDGEICLRGPKVTSGYWRDAEKTAASFFAGGWFRTGDVGHLDGDGFLFLTDRKKDMILSGGENIASSEVERVLYDLSAVHEAAAIGLPDEKWGETVTAVIVTRPGESLTLDQVQAHCRAHLAGFKVPRRLVLQTELPRNPSGKVLKRALRAALS
jgi:fatty-acyl-CoA synthase